VTKLLKLARITRRIRLITSILALPNEYELARLRPASLTRKGAKVRVFGIKIK
jgi:hypothetical protein